MIPNGLFEKKNPALILWIQHEAQELQKRHGARLSGATPPKDCSGVTNIGDHQMISMSIACYRLTSETTTTTRYCLHPCNVYSLSLRQKNVFFVMNGLIRDVVS